MNSTEKLVDMHCHVGLLGDEEMMAPTRTFPQVRFQEDMQVIYDTGWTGAKVVYSGHLGSPDGKSVTEGRAAYLSYEHLHPSEWPSMTGEGYRRCCTSLCWVGSSSTTRIFFVMVITGRQRRLLYIRADSI